MFSSLLYPQFKYVQFIVVSRSVHCSWGDVTPKTSSPHQNNLRPYGVEISFEILPWKPRKVNKLADHNVHKFAINQATFSTTFCLPPFGLKKMQFRQGFARWIAWTNFGGHIIASAMRCMWRPSFSRIFLSWPKLQMRIFSWPMETLENHTFYWYFSASSIAIKPKKIYSTTRS